MSMRISVAPTGWGNASPTDIQALLLDTASHVNRLLRSPFEGTIEVMPAKPDMNPVVLYRGSPDEPFRVLLSARDMYWSRFAFQFSHEFCHIVSGYERLKGNPNNWFHESVCELASVFSILRMSEQWRRDPPYPNWVGYASSLEEYEKQHRLSRPQVQWCQGPLLISWLKKREKCLRNNPYRRDWNVVVAYALLPVFESTPTGWNAVQTLPASARFLKDYLMYWHASVLSGDRQFVKRISRTLGYSI